MADAVGGVPICPTEAIDDPDTGLDLPAGVSVASGQSALSYLRSRHGVGDGRDLARISSQQASSSSGQPSQTRAGSGSGSHSD